MAVAARPGYPGAADGANIGAGDTAANNGGSGTAAGKVLDVLGAFAPDTRELTLSSIARRSGLALSTAHRIVAELTAWGALERGDDGRYRIGLRLYEVAALAPRGLALRDAAMPFMEDLYEVTHEVVQLAVREGTELVFIERIAGRTSVGVHTRVGGRFPLPPSGAGLVLLAFAPAAAQEAVLNSPLQRFTPRTVVEAARLRRMLADVRRSDIAVSDRQVTMDSVSVAAPVRDPAGAVVAAVSVVVHADTLDLPVLCPLVRTAARGISRSLAGPSALRPAAASPAPVRSRR